jgi:hypothetical protein
MFPVKVPSGRAIPVAFAAAGVVALASLTACGSSASSATAPAASASTSVAGTSGGASAAGSGSAAASSPSAPSSSAAGASSAPATGASPASTAPVTGTAASALAARAFTNTQNAASVRVAGSAVNTGSGGQRVTFNLTLVKSAGCSGTIALSKTQTFKIVETGGYVWLLPSAAFYQSLKLSKSAQALVQDKYIKVKTTDSQITDLTKVCSFNGLFGSLPKPSGTTFKALPTNYNGQPAFAVTQAGKPGTAVISNSATPVVLRLTDPGSAGGTILFTDYDATTKITPPSAGESIDGGQLGL